MVSRSCDTHTIHYVKFSLLLFFSLSLSLLQRDWGQYPFTTLFITAFAYYPHPPVASFPSATVRACCAPPQLPTDYETWLSLKLQYHICLKLTCPAWQPQPKPCHVKFIDHCMSWPDYSDANHRSPEVRKSALQACHACAPVPYVQYNTFLYYSLIFLCPYYSLDVLITPLYNQYYDMLWPMLQLMSWLCSASDSDSALLPTLTHPDYFHTI